MIFLRIDGDPVRYYYRNSDALPHLPPKASRLQLLTSLSPLRSEVGGENTNVTATLAMTALTAQLFAVPPLGAVATLEDEDGAEHFVGRVESVDLNADGCTLGLEA